jgi:hypothetical protein
VAGQVKAGFQEQLVASALGLSFGVAKYQLSIVLARLRYGAEDAAGRGVASSGAHFHTAGVDAGTDAGTDACRYNPPKSARYRACGDDEKRPVVSVVA